MPTAFAGTNRVNAREISQVQALTSDEVRRATRLYGVEFLFSGRLVDQSGSIKLFSEYFIRTPDPEVGLSTGLFEALRAQIDQTAFSEPILLSDSMVQH